MKTMSSRTTPTSASQTGSSSSPCGCQGQTPSQACCCNLVCFDRPNYFCGHLLTDADLTLQQKYVVEKNKLYHRTMDGCGVVCGLKLTCDCDCKGNILIHDGFAIDDCGNDLVVCETTRFDVIHALRCKDLLVSDPHEDDCEPRRHKSRCEIRQCFYVTICYDETESEYETPFQSSCTSGPKQCMPTRIHEGWRFDVTDKLPAGHSYLDDLEKRIKECFELNCDSPLGAIVKQHAAELLRIFGDTQYEAREGQTIEPCELFCMLRAYFLNYLKTKPDQFNCNLLDEVSCLSCPKDCGDEDRRRGDKEWEKIYLTELRESFRKLLYYMQRYQYDCVFGDLIFSCQQPCEAHCLVLGTVEVLNGKLIRVCNTPRKYLWAPANLIQVLIYSIMTGGLASCGDADGRKVPCCPDYCNFDPLYFLAEFRVSQCGRRDAATSSARAIREVAQSLHKSFDFTDSMAISPEIFADALFHDRTAFEHLEQVKTLFGISSSTEELQDGATLNLLTPMQAFQSNALLRRNDSVVAYKSQGKQRALTDFLAQVTPNREVGQSIEELVTAPKPNAQQIADLQAEIEALKKRLDNMDESRKAKKQ
jgi:hypothetical protein